MGTIAQKLEYLNTTKGLIKDSINLTGANITNDTFRSYAQKLKLGLINALNDNGETIFNNLEKVSGKGSNLSLTPTYEAPIVLNGLYGNTSQTGTPTPSSPVPIQSVTGLQNVGITGKNLLDDSTFKNRDVPSNQGFFINGFSYTIKSGTYRFGVFVDNQLVTTNSVVALSFRKGATSVLEKVRPNEDFEITNEQASQINNISIYLNNTFVSTYSGKKITGVMITKSEITTYEPYKGNTYEVNLGKNLLDITTLDYGYVGSNGSIVNSHDAGEMHSTFIKVKPNTTYTFKIFETSTTYNNWFVAGEYSSNSYSSFIQRDTMTTATQNYITFTTTATTQYVIVSARNLASATKIQLEKGSTATSYSPYFTPIELNKIGDYEDSIKKSTGKNLFDKDNANIINGNLTDGGTLSSTNNARTLYIPCKNNTTYTISKLQAVYFRVAQFTNVPQIGDSYISRTKDDLANSITFTTTTGNYLAVTYWYNTSTYTEQQVLDSLMINEGSTALPYEPYGKVWYITKNEIKYNVDTTQLTLISGYSNIEYAQIPKQNNYVGYNSYDQVDILCDRALNIKQAPSGWNDSSLVNKISGNPDKLKWWVGFTKGTGLDAIKTALTGSYIVYPLSTPIYEVITNTELINQLESLNNAKSKNGTTNINVTSEDLSMLMDVSVIKGDE